MPACRSLGCDNEASLDRDFCGYCIQEMVDMKPTEKQSLSEKYPNYYKRVDHLEELDVYAVHQLFNIQDPSGAIQHSSKKLLLSGVRTGGKSRYKDIKEARDTLTRWLQLNEDNQ